MVIAKLTRPSDVKDYTLTLYCIPDVISEVLSKLPEKELPSVTVEFIKVVE